MKDLILRAARFAADAHRGQTRKNSETPYIVHPGRVAMAATLHPAGTPELVAAAWLHDTLEDTEATYADLLDQFGSRVADIVRELTNQFDKAAHPDKNRRQRKALEIARLAEVSREAKILKLLDRRDNIEDRPGDDVGFLRLYARETRDLLEAVGDADPDLAGRVLLAVKRLERQVELVETT